MTEQPNNLVDTPTHPATVVRTSVEVSAPPDRAFAVFTDGFDTWWNRSHHLLGGELVAVGIEPVVGGRVWEESDSGGTCTWGRVLVWDPPRRLEFSWLIGPDWAVPGPDAVGSRVTVTFTPSASGTTVTLVHDGFERHGPGWEAVRDGVGSDGGWPGLLRLFAAAA
jgi:uncharacterized protein YndB with AHSA1/START domain